MDWQDQAGNSFDRREMPRWTVNSFINATATFFKAKPLKNGDNNPCCTGMLVNISEKGAQAILPDICTEYFVEHQVTRMQITATQEKIHAEFYAEIIFITKNELDSTTRFGVKFMGLEKNDAARKAVKKLCNLVKELRPVNIN